MLFSVLVLLAVIATACGPAAPAAEEAPAADAPQVEQSTSEQAPAEEPSTDTDDSAPVTLWTQLNTDSPASSRDKMFAELLPKISTAIGREAININQPYDQITSKINLAVQAGGEVPDIVEVQSLAFSFFHQNEILEDITDYVQAAPWYELLSPTALAPCTGPDGRIYCVPTAVATSLILYYPELWPNGFPTTTDEFLKEAERLKGEGYFAITGKFSEAYGAEFILFPLIKSFGGSVADQDGNLNWASPETVKAVEFVRELVQKGYAPESTLGPGFDMETPFKNGKAAAIMTGSWTYTFLNPIETPSGEKYDLGGDTIQKAVDDGKVAIAPILAAPDGKHFSTANGRNWGIPKGAKNIKGAEAFIDFIMQPENATTFALAFGNMPTLAEAKESDPRYSESKYWQTIVKEVEPYVIPLDPIPGNVDQVMLKLADTVSNVVLNPKADIMTELKKAQDETSAMIEAEK